MRLLILAAVASAVPSLAYAGAADCESPQSTHDQNVCARLDLEAADAALNAAFQRALAKIAKSGQDKPHDPAAWEGALRAAQRAWIAFRDADCKGEVPFAWSGGSGTTAAVLGCMTIMTKARTRELTERFDEN